MDAPIQIEIASFHLVIKEDVFESFIKRMKELNYAHAIHFDGKVHYICEKEITTPELFLEIHKKLVVNTDGTQELYYRFRDNFYDKRDESPLYNILEAMCVKYKGTMIAMYKSYGQKWGVKIVKGERDFSVTTCEDVEIIKGFDDFFEGGN